MRILGIDPGSRVTGFGLIEEKENKTFVVNHGLIKPPEAESFPLKLKFIYSRLEKLLGEFNPQVLALENVFFAKNVKSVLRLGEVRGVVQLAAAQAGLEVAEYSPLEVKQSVVGYGQAGKEQILKMVCALLKLEESKLRHDTSDALAVALCHLHSAAFKQRIMKKL